jgi:hypothetical protein
VKDLIARPRTILNVFTKSNISTNQALQSIRPVDKDRFDHFDREACQNPLFNIIHLPRYILSLQAGFFSQPKRKNRMMQYPGYMVAAACV